MKRLKVLAVALAVMFLSVSAQAGTVVGIMHFFNLLSTDVKSTSSSSGIVNASFVSPLICFQSELYVEPWFFEIDLSQLMIAIPDIITGGASKMDMNAFSLGIGYSFTEGNLGLGLAGSVEINTLTGLVNGSFGGFGLEIFSVLNMGEKMYLIPKFKYIFPVFNNKSGAEVDYAIELSCSTAFMLTDGFGISIQPLYSIRPLTLGGSANRIGIRLGIAID
jgi:hypothetical protein